VGQSADRALSTLDILLSRRRWKQEAPSVEALRKQIKGACDQLRVAVESALSERGAV
jgi:septum formation topological specificity factor MinE